MNGKQKDIMDGYDFSDEYIRIYKEGEEKEDVIHEIAESQVDVYTRELIKWLGAEEDSFQYVDEALVEIGAESIESALRIGQYLFYQDKYRGDYADFEKAMNDAKGGKE